MSALDESMAAAWNAIDEKFLFRKLGLPYDFASNPDDFPSQAFATARDVRGGLPNPQGEGSGLACMCRNHSLVFDASLLRVELGINTDADTQRLDRLIGGLIRLATVAPKGFLVGGLTADGRGFYAQPQTDNHAAWAWSAWRGMSTAAIAPESQEKFHSIAQKWFARARREEFHLKTVDGKPAPHADLDEAGPLLPAMFRVAAWASGSEQDMEEYAAKADENGRARLAPGPDACAAADLGPLLWRQACLTLLAESDPDKDRQAAARAAMRAAALAAAPHVCLWRQWDKSLIDTPVDLDWRGRPTADTPLGFAPHESWQRLINERTPAAALQAMLVVLLSADRELANAHAEEMAQALTEIDWGAFVSLEPLAAAVAVHAHGADMGLWEAPLCPGMLGPDPAATTLVAKYMTPEYDELNPDKAGHTEPPPAKNHAGEQGSHGKRHRRKRRK